MTGETSYLPFLPLKLLLEFCLVIEGVALKISHLFYVCMGGWDPLLAKGAVCSLQVDA